jgi:hypothetical protein
MDGEGGREEEEEGEGGVFLVSLGQVAGVG